jgi:hypothetical protein
MPVGIGSHQLPSIVTGAGKRIDLDSPHESAAPVAPILNSLSIFLFTPSSPVKSSSSSPPSCPTWKNVLTYAEPPQSPSRQMRKKTLVIVLSTPEVGGVFGGVYSGEERTKRLAWRDRVRRTRPWTIVGRGSRWRGMAGRPRDRDERERKTKVWSERCQRQSADSSGFH